MARSNVYLTASNDYREVSVGGRGNSNTGRSWINFDWFKKDIRQVRNMRYKKQEVMRDEEYVIQAGTTAITTSVYRSKDGSTSISVSCDPPKDILPKIISIGFYFAGGGIALEASEINSIWKEAVCGDSTIIIWFANKWLEKHEKEFTPDNIKIALQVAREAMSKEG